MYTRLIGLLLSSFVVCACGGATVVRGYDGAELEESQVAIVRSLPLCDAPAGVEDSIQAGAAPPADCKIGSPDRNRLAVAIVSKVDGKTLTAQGGSGANAVINAGDGGFTLHLTPGTHVVDVAPGLVAYSTTVSVDGGAVSQSYNKSLLQSGSSQPVRVKVDAGRTYEFVLTVRTSDRKLDPTDIAKVSPEELADLLRYEPILVDFKDVRSGQSAMLKTAASVTSTQ